VDVGADSLQIRENGVLHLLTVEVPDKEYRTPSHMYLLKMVPVYPYPYIVRSTDS
jgi:hypothetical protein